MDRRIFGLENEYGVTCTFRGSRSRAGFFGEDVVGIASISFLHGGRGRAEVVAIPAQRQACSLRDSHDVPASRNGMAEGMKAASRVHGRAIGRCEDYAGSSDCGTDRACASNTHAYGSGGLVSCSGYNRRSAAQAGCFGSGSGNLAANLWRLEQRWQ